MFNKTIRIFLSSTFADMKAERNALHRGAFQYLRQRCEARGFQFQVVDLRWGVREEAAYDQRTEDICLEEIRRCQRVTPRPNFVALIGERYGWRPLPLTLTQADWKHLLSLGDVRFELLAGWYQLDRNNIPPVYRLRRRETEHERDPVFWAESVEVPLREFLVEAVTSSDISNLSTELTEADLSLTEKEIRRGAGSAAQNDWAAFVYFREFDDIDRSDLTAPWIDEDGSGASSDPRAGAKLTALREWLEKRPKVATRSYAASLIRDSDGGLRVTAHALEMLDAEVRADLEHSIDNQIADFDAADPLEVEIRMHDEFAQQRRTNFVDRPETKMAALRSLTVQSRWPLVIHGSSGSGKTALMSELSAVIRKRYSSSVVVVRFIGATSASTALGPLIEDIHAEVARASGSDDRSQALASDPQASLHAAFALATEERPVIVLLDALDQLMPDDRAHSGLWIPRELPPNSRLIVSCMSGADSSEVGTDVFPALEGRLARESFVAIGRPDIKLLIVMLDEWLGYYGRTVSKQQRAAIVSKFDVCPRPLFLRILVEIVRQWNADYQPDSLPDSISSAIARFLQLLESQGAHGRPLLETTLGAIGASRDGLSEVEIVDLLNTDKAVLSEFETTSRHEYPDEREALPPIIWSRLFFDLAFFLGNTTAAGVSVLGFYHRQLGSAVRDRYLAQRSKLLHQKLADYFEAAPVWYERDGAVGGDPYRSPNARRAYELAHQLRSIGSEQAVHKAQQLLLSDDAVDAKIEAGLTQDLLRDYREAETIRGVALDRLVHYFKSRYLQEGTAIAAAYTPASLHSFFTYRETKEQNDTFYRRLLRSIAEPRIADGNGHARLRARAAVDLAGLLRRDRSFEAALRLLNESVSNDSPLSNQDLAVAWYEIGYVQYVNDDYRGTVEAMDKSIECARAANDDVGAGISLSVQMWASYFLTPTDARLQQIVAEQARALDVFEQRSRHDPRAFRWVMNALTHLIDACVLLGDSDNALQYMRNLRASPWVREYASPDRLLPYEARCAMCRGDWNAATALWADFFATNKESTQIAAQGAAWLFFDYGMSLAADDKLVKATLVFSEGLRLEQSGTQNGYWQQRIREARARLPLSARVIAFLVRRLISVPRVRSE